MEAMSFSGGVALVAASLSSITLAAVVVSNRRRIATFFVEGESEDRWAEQFMSMSDWNFEEAANANLSQAEQASVTAAARTGLALLMQELQ